MRGSCDSYNKSYNDGIFVMTDHSSVKNHWHRYLKVCDEIVRNVKNVPN